MKATAVRADRVIARGVSISSLTPQTGFEGSGLKSLSAARENERRGPSMVSREGLEPST